MEVVRGLLGGLPGRLLFKNETIIHLLSMHKAFVLQRVHIVNRPHHGFLPFRSHWRCIDNCLLLQYDIRHMSRYERAPGPGLESPREKLDATMKSLEEGVDTIVGSEEFGRYLSVMGRFHQYSFGNITLIHVQRPEATRVAGYKRWQELGRQVRRGEQGVKILVPHRKKLQSEDETEEQVVIRSFGVGTVFDVSQTEGEPLPEPPVVREIRESTDIGAALFRHICRYLDSEGIPVAREDTSPANGYWEPLSRRIAVGLHLEGDQRTKTLAHETAHFVADHQLGMAKEDVETVAESAAYVVLQHYGIDSSGYSFGYVARWAKDRQVLKRNLDAIQRTAHTIIEGIEGCPIDGSTPDLPNDSATDSSRDY